MAHVIPEELFILHTRLMSRPKDFSNRTNVLAPSFRPTLTSANANCTPISYVTLLPFGDNSRFCHSDMLVGDNFLRSVYSVYDFGDFDESGKMGDPYMQLLSLVDPDEASKDFAQNRGSQPKTNITYVGLNGTMIQPLFSLSTQANQTLDTIGKFFPAILGIAALNALVVLVVVIGAVVYMCRKRQRATRTARVPRGRQTHMELNSVSSYVAGMPGPIHSHTYAPVSMALTEDSFVPPSPAFHSDGLQSGERPKSIA